MPRFSANLSFLFNELPFLDRFAAAAKRGLPRGRVRIRLRIPAARDRGAARRETGSRSVLINTPPGELAAGERGLAALPGREHEFVASLATALRYAEALPARGCTSWRGSSRRAPTPKRARGSAPRSCATCGCAAREAQEQGVELTIEPINPRDIPGYLLNTQAEAHAIREEVGAANLKVQMDLYHAQIVEGDLSEKLGHCLPHIGHIQIAGVPGRHEPDVGEINYASPLRAASTSWATRAGSAANTARCNGTVAGLGWMKALCVVPLALTAPPPCTG